MLTDRQIAQIVADKEIIENFAPESITNIGYDLTTSHFLVDGKEKQHVSLNPQESVFVAAREKVRLPADMICVLYLKNSRMRQGLTMDAPIYQPGHYTRLFFRLTNVSSDIIELSADSKYVMATFDRLSEDAEKPYNGTFADEDQFKNLGEYQNIYKNELVKIENKRASIENMERIIYSNVLVILTVFVALFSFLTTNIALVAEGVKNIKTFLMVDFTLLGGISFLLTILSEILGTKGKKLSGWMAALMLIVALIIYIY